MLLIWFCLAWEDIPVEVKSVKLVVCVSTQL